MIAEEKSTRGGGVGGPKRRCRYGAECRNIGKGCKFHHPPSSTATGAVTNDTKKKPNPNKNSEKNAASKKDISKTQCRYGMECRNTKCPFFHHPAAVPVSSPNSPGDVAADAVLPNGKPSPKLSPSFADMYPQLGEMPSHCVPVEHPTPFPYASGKTTPVPTTPSRKATTKKKCRWGAGCRNKKCTFFHPGQQLDAAMLTPKQKAAAATADLGNSKNSKILPHRAAPSLPGTWAKAARPAVVHPILPPSRDTQDPVECIEDVSYPPGLLFPTSHQSEVSIPSFPFSQAEVAITPLFYAASSTTQTTEALSRFSHMFSPVSNAPASGFLDGGSREGRTPLYSKTSCALQNPHPLKGGEMNGFGHQPTVVEAVKEDQSEAVWLANLLGLNDIDVTTTAAGSGHMQMTSAIDDVVENPYASASNSGNNIALGSAKTNFIHILPGEQMRPTSERDSSHKHAATMSNNLLEEGRSKKLVPEDVIVQSRRAALELRFESQQTAYNHELLCSLLQTCRSKQVIIKTALERSMEPGASTEAEVDENNLVALLELNELLVGAIDTAELSLRITKKRDEEGQGNSVKKVSVAKSSPKRSAKGSHTDDNALWKPVDKKAVTTPTSKAAQRKSKPTEITAKPKKSVKKMAKVPIVDNEKQEEKPGNVAAKAKSHIDDSVSKAAQEAAETAQKEKEKIAAQDAAEAAQQEKEKMARLLEEARKQSAAAKEKNKSKKNKKFDRWLKQNEEARETRAKAWSERIAKENDYIDLIQKLLVAEFLRQSKNKAMGLTADRVLSDSHTSELIAKECREAYSIIFGGCKCRVVVAGSETKDMNGRQGTLRYWDKEKEKYCVGLDTKKAPDSDLQFLIPAILDILTSSRPLKGDKKTSATSYDVDASDFMSYGGVSLGFSFPLQKYHINALGSAESTKIGLADFCESRDEEERQQKIEEEAEKKREEEDRHRRAARRAKENTAWEQRKDQMRKDKEEYEEMKKEWAKERHENGGSKFDYEDDEDEVCQCPRCRWRRFGDSRFGDRFSSSGGAFFFNIGGIPFRVRFDSYDSDEDSCFDEEFDERWEDQLAEEKEEENRKQARILGVMSNADGRTIKLAYRKKALQFHPDKWKSDSDHGMTRKEAENQFKFIQSAYDHLMSNFDG